MSVTLLLSGTGTVSNTRTRAVVSVEFGTVLVAVVVVVRMVVVVVVVD